MAPRTQKYTLKETDYKIILDSVADGVFTVDENWKITSWNKAAEHITGFTREEALGQLCCEIFRTNVCQTDCVLRRTMETGEEFLKFPLNIITKDGSKKPISVSSAILRTASGKAIGGVETFRDLSQVETLRKALRKEYTFEDIVGKSHQMQELFKVLPDIAKSDSTVLIEGPSGTGKELFARAVHNISLRKAQPFIAVNCGALPDTLLESELFGYKKGAFTDAKLDKPGRFDLADGGTIFLDEIGDISGALQVKLLRVLQEKSYEPLGATVAKSVDVRVIAATNKNLREQMKVGRFRDDLYFRLNVIRLEIPPLSERKVDIPLLIDTLIARLNAEKQKQFLGVTPEAMDVLMHYEYPGNVRELENILEHAFILCKSKLIDVPSLPSEIVPESLRDRPETVGQLGPLESAEAEAILRALAQNGGHREKTAKALGIHKTTLIRKMKKLQITFTPV
jgi:PAS domain S-box-containing protein